MARLAVSKPRVSRCRSSLIFLLDEVHAGKASDYRRRIIGGAVIYDDISSAGRVCATTLEIASARYRAWL